MYQLLYPNNYRSLFPIQLRFNVRVFDYIPSKVFSCAIKRTNVSTKIIGF